MKAIKQFLREHWPIVVLLLLLLCVVPPVIVAIGSAYNFVTGFLRNTFTLLKVPVTVAEKVFDFVGEWIGKPLAAMNTAAEAQPVLKLAIVVGLFLAAPVAAVFVGLWYLRDLVYPSFGNGLTPAPEQPAVNVLPDREERTFQDYFA